MSETNLRIVSTTNITPDLELLREEAESLYGIDWSNERFYQRDYLYSVAYVDDVPTAMSCLQQHFMWTDLDVVGICRRFFSKQPDSTALTTSHVGTFGQPMFIDQWNKAQELGITKLVAVSPTEAFVNSCKARLPKYKELTGQDWYVGDNTFETMPGCFHYVMWTGQEECYFQEAS